jgi:hypothetical protein
LIPKGENLATKASIALGGAALKEEHARKQESQVHIASIYLYLGGDCKNLVQEREKSDIAMTGSLISVVTTQRGFIFQMVRARYDHFHFFQLVSLHISISIYSCSCIASKQVVVLILYYYLLPWLCCHQSQKIGRL